MAVKSRSVPDPAAPELNEKSVVAAGASSRRTTMAGNKRPRDDDQSVRDATRQFFVGLALADGVVPTT